MPKIRILPDRVANQIAAGEVIERPAAVVKELVENSLDAGATRIEVEFNHGGRSFMRIEDNGCGMSRDDALLCLERHATSKIAEAEDLNSLASFGFRGEALPSVASVSRFTLQTREATSESGTEVLVNGGRLIHVRDCGRPVGTRIEVAQLFHPVPARRKFLKTDQTEAAHIVQCVRLYALACPQVSFTLIEDGRVVFRSPECPRLLDRVGEIFGRQFMADLVPIEAQEGELTLRGLVGKPAAARPTRHELVTFINGRPVDSRTVNYALIESYHEHIAKGRYPMAFVFLGIDPASVDVNVHPAKREVRFRSEQQVRSFIIRSVLQRLRELGQSLSPLQQPLAGVSPLSATGLRGEPVDTLVPPQVPATTPPAPVAPAPVIRALPTAHVQGGGRFLTETGRISVESRPAPVASILAPGASALAPSASVALPVPAAPAPVLTSWRFVGLAQGGLALFDAPGGVVVMDRKAALERVWFERMLARHDGAGIAVQRLLLPGTVEFDPVSSALLKDKLSLVEGHGFEVSEFGRNCFRVEAVPDWMEPGEAVEFLRELTGALREGRLQGRDTRVWHEEFSRMAATRAARLPQRVSETEMMALVRELFSTRSPLTSPAGRPTYFELSQGELSRRLQK